MFNSNSQSAGGANMMPTHKRSECPTPPDLTNYIVKTEDQYSNCGSFGDVYKCLYYRAGVRMEVAVKAFRFKFTVSEDDAGQQSAKMKMDIRRELGIWKRLDHQNIVPLLGTAYGFGMRGASSLVSPWMPNGTLHSFLAKHDQSLRVPHRLQLLLDVANGLNYLHSFPIRPIVHGDLSSNNVLVDANYTARLADFGYASLIGNIPEAFRYLQMSTRQGTLRWAAPELVFPQDLEAPNRTTKSDIYSFGNISLQVLSGKLPWSEIKEEPRIVLCLAQGLNPGRPEHHKIGDQHWGFIQQCWSSSASKRPSAESVIASIQLFLRHTQPFSTTPAQQSRPVRVLENCRCEWRDQDGITQCGEFITPVIVATHLSEHHGIRKMYRDGLEAWPCAWNGCGRCFISQEALLMHVTQRHLTNVLDAEYPRI